MEEITGAKNRRINLLILAAIALVCIVGAVMALFAGQLGEKDGKSEPQRTGEGKQAASRESEKPKKLETIRPKGKCPFGFDKPKGGDATGRNCTKAEDPKTTPKKQRSVISPKRPKRRHCKGGRHHKRSNPPSHGKEPRTVPRRRRVLFTSSVTRSDKKHKGKRYRDT